jgi:AcrR family transcriptional regulator
MREQIMRAAGDLFGDNGYAGTSVGAIAEAVEISPAALYWHFDSKEALFVELLVEAIESYARSLDQALTGVIDPADQLRRLALAHAESVLTDPKVSKSVFSAYTLAHSISPESYRRIHDRQRDQIERWRRVVDAGAERGEFHVSDTAVVVFALTDICEATGSWANADGRLTPREIGEEYGEFALRVAGYGLPAAPPRIEAAHQLPPSTPDRQQSDKPQPDASLRDTVIREAAALFRAKGFPGTSVGDIARASKMSPASLYWHFSNKEHLLYELVTAALDDYERFVDASLDGVEGPVAQLAAFARGHVLSVYDDPNVSNMAVAHTFGSLARWLSAEHRTEIRSRLLHQFHRCRAIIREGKKQGVFLVDHPSLAAWAVLDMCDAAASWYDPSGRYPVDWVVDEYAEYAVRIVGWRMVEAGRGERASALVPASAASGVA